MARDRAHDGLNDKRRKWIAAVVLAATAAALVFIPTLRLVPWFLVESEAPVRSDAIVALGGDGGSRVDRAVELWKQGWAPILVVSGGPIFRETTWASLMRARAVELGVPPEAVVVQDRSWTTAEDAVYTAKILRDRGAKRVIVVTSSWHSARSLGLFRDAEPGIAWVSCPLEPEWSGDWWNDPATARSVTSEVLKLFWPDRPR